MAQISPETLLKLNALNAWLVLIYDEEIHISDILKKANFADEELEKLKRHYLKEYIEAVLSYIKTLTEGRDGIRRNEIMLRYYGLNTGLSETLQSIADDLNLSRERIRQIRDKRLRFFRSKKSKTKIELELVAIANHLLKRKT